MKSGPKAPRTEPPVIEVFFILGTILVVVGFLWSLAKSWPSLDPLALATLVGIGLLLVVVCERLRLAVREIRTLTTLMRSAIADAQQEPPA
jgi:hypothetical protein